MKIKNEDLRRRIIDAGVFDYQVAKRIGVDVETLHQWLRSDLAEDQRARILSVLPAVDRAKE